MCRLQFRLSVSAAFTVPRRFISSNEVSTALRPFYFAVHPDFFSNYPLEKEVNENSLKQLNGLLDAITRRGRAPSALSLKFFMRSKELQNVFQPITVKVNGSSIRSTVESVLKACDLPPPKNISKLDSNRTKPVFYSSTYQAFSGRNFTAESWSEAEFVNKKQGDGLVTLVNWLKANAETARLSLKEREAIKGEIRQLRDDLIGELKLADLKWTCGWNTEHFKGCLRSLKCLANQHPAAMVPLKGRTVVFGNETGVDLYGHVSLNSGEVRHNWLEMIQRVPSYDATLNKIPSYEKALSRAMREIRVTRRRFGPSLLAEDYELQLRRLVTAIGDFKCRRSFPLALPEDLSHLQLVVETAAGPLMLTPTGQIVTPSSCPIFLLLNFISENHIKAKELLDSYLVDHKKEEELRLQCVRDFELYSLEKDDNITPVQMIEFLEKLTESGEKLSDVKGAKVYVTNYYSVLANGELCIPWNFR